MCNLIVPKNPTTSARVENLRYTSDPGPPESGSWSGGGGERALPAL